MICSARLLRGDGPFPYPHGGHEVTITLADLLPGDLLFGPIDGMVPGVFPVGAGQLLLADRAALSSWRAWWQVRHVAVVVEAGGTASPWPRIVQAMPGGAEEVSIDTSYWTPGFVYLRPRYGTVQRLPGLTKLSAVDQALRVAEAARRYVGTKYSFLDYAAIAGRHFGLRSAKVRNYITTSGHMICSQLADQALADAGYHVFTDGRLPQDVTPAELYRQLLTLPGHWIRPGGGTDGVSGWMDNSLLPTS
jgi:hypothetical protein